MKPKSVLTRARSRLPQEMKRVQLELRRRQTDGDLFVDYGWIHLLYSGDGDHQELAYHLNQRRWHEMDMNVFRSLIAPGQTAIDVGANMGLVTTMFASIVGREGRVLSFEPSPVVFGKLQKTIAANRLDQVIPLNIGCGSSTSIERLNQISRSSGNASIIAEGRDAVEIEVQRLDDVAEVWADRVALLKIDTEGYEPEVLEGAAGMIEQHKPIIYLEMGGGFLASTLRSIEFLERAGYGVDHVRYVDWSAVGRGSDYFFLPHR